MTGLPGSAPVSVIVNSSMMNANSRLARTSRSSIQNQWPR